MLKAEHIDDAASFPTWTVETGSPLHIQGVLKSYKGKMKY